MDSCWFTSMAGLHIMITGLCHQRPTFIPLVGLISVVTSIHSTRKSCRLQKVKASVVMLMFILLTNRSWLIWQMAFRTYASINCLWTDTWDLKLIAARCSDLCCNEAQFNCCNCVSGYTKEFTWDTYLVEVSNIPAPYELFTWVCWFSAQFVSTKSVNSWVIPISITSHTCRLCWL